MSVFLIRKPRSVFIHIPKTGGASIRHGFFAGNVEGPKHGFIPESWKPCFKFAFVRNPYDRLISAWKMFRSGMEQTVWERPTDTCDISLREFLQISTDESIRYDGARATTAEKIRHHVIPQTHPFHCLSEADFVGRFETLQADFAEVCRRLEIHFESLPHWNRTDGKEDYLGYYDAESRSVVEQFYRDDFEQLGYEMVNSAE